MYTKYSQILMITTTSAKRRITMSNLLVIYITISPLTVTVCGRTPYYYIVRGLEAMRMGFTPHSLQWHHNGRDSVSHHQPHDCLLRRLFRRRAKKTLKIRVTGFVWGIHRRPVNSPPKWPVMRKMSPFDDVIMFFNLVIRRLTAYWRKTRTSGPHYSNVITSAMA